MSINLKKLKAAFGGRDQFWSPENNPTLELAYDVALDFPDANYRVEHEKSNFRGVYAHPDLTVLLRCLVPHMLEMCEMSPPLIGGQIKEFDIPLDERIKAYRDGFKLIGYSNYYLGGIAFGGDEQFAGVTLFGGKTLGNKKVFNLTTPFYMFETPDGVESAYRYIGDLMDICNEINEECSLFVEQGKCTLMDGQQLNLFENTETKFLNLLQESTKIQIPFNEQSTKMDRGPVGFFKESIGKA